MFESNPKTVSDMMAVVNKHADMDRSEPTDRPRHRDDDPARPGGDRPPRHSKNRDRAESSKARNRKRDPDNAVAIAD